MTRERPLAGDDRRFPRRVYGSGSEPDVRFSLANERTYLAWIRTSLALLAVGIALEALQLPIERGFSVVATFIFIALGALAPVQAWLGWMRTERALRSDRPLPAPMLAGPLGAGTFIAAALLLVGLLLR
ncbi:YidH family protein [Georgenia sp. AZ-5]|uniref:YidH family protein n=1 Tax=Georgenia sp. AZ-5 TaxID=3367526 RepID=UPI00375464C6